MACTCTPSASASRTSPPPAATSIPARPANLEVGPDGAGKLTGMTTRITLSPGPLSIFDTDGTAVIIHGNEDQGITGEPKSGVSGGPRLACGVIVK